MDNIQLYCLNYSQRLEEKDFQQCLSDLPVPIQLEIKAYKHWESAQASLLGKMLLSYAFKHMDIPFSVHQLQLTEKDRPYIEGNIDFNISHSGEYVMLAVSQSAKVGIDIEKHRQLDYLLFRKYFSDNEWALIEAADNKITAFFDFWAIKESAIKCDGRGVEVLSKTQVDYNEGISLGVKYSDKIYCDGRLLFFQPLNVNVHYSCCVSSNQMINVDLHHLTIQDLLKSK